MQVSLNSVKIYWQTTVKHLGNFLMYNLHDEGDIWKKKSNFIMAINKLNTVFASVNAELKLCLLQIYCASWYGCQARRLGTPCYNIMNVEWQKGVRRTAGSPRHTSVLLPGLADDDNCHSQHECRFDRLFKTLSTNSIAFDRWISRS